MDRREANKRSGRTSLALWAAGTGALLTYFLDPERGRRRRAILRDKTYSRINEIGDATRLIAKDTGNRARGALAMLRGRARGQTVSDDILIERVRAKIGRVVSHPKALQITVDGDTVTLCGPILKREAKAALHAADSVIDNGNADARYRRGRHGSKARDRIDRSAGWRPEA